VKNRLEEILPLNFITMKFKELPEKCQEEFLFNEIVMICVLFLTSFLADMSSPPQVRNVLFPYDRYMVTLQYTYTCIPKESLL